MNRKFACVALGSLLIALRAFAEAQQPPKIPRVGLLAPGSRSAFLPDLEAFRNGLRELSYTEGKNIVLEYRYPERNNFDSLAADLANLKLDVIVTATQRGVTALKRATHSIPIVMITGDAVRNGFVSSLSRPGGNITGLSFLSPEVRGKQFEFLKEAFPKISRVAVFLDPAQYSDISGDVANDIEIARPIGLQAQIIEVRQAQEFESAFKIAGDKRVGALLFRAHPLFRVQQNKLLDLAAKSGLPAMYPWKEFVEAGGLMTYGPNAEDLYRRAATYVDKILKGAKPAELPVEQPKKFELVINLKTAKQIGLTIPPNVLARADRVIK